MLPDEEEESEQKMFARKALGTQVAIEEKEQQDLSTYITEIVTIPLNMAVYEFEAINENARIRNEQNADPHLEALKLRLLHEEYDKHILKTKPRSRNLLRLEERTIVKDGVLMRKHYGEDGTVTHRQTLHGKTNKHRGITIMIQECRMKYHYPDQRYQLGRLELG